MPSIYGSSNPKASDAQIRTMRKIVEVLYDLGDDPDGTTIFAEGNVVKGGDREPQILQKALGILIGGISGGAGAVASVNGETGAVTLTGDEINYNSAAPTNYLPLTSTIDGHLSAINTALMRNGFIDYNNTNNPTSLVADTWTTLPNNGAGAFTNKNFPPSNVTELMDVTDGSIDTSEMNLGDTILIRNDFSVTPSTNNALLELRYQLGSGLGAYVLETVVGRLDDGSGKAYRFALKPDLIYMGDDNTRDNPITIQIKLSTDGSVSNAGSVIHVIRR